MNVINVDLLKEVRCTLFIRPWLEYCAPRTSTKIFLYTVHTVFMESAHRRSSPEVPSFPDCLYLLLYF